MTVARPDLPRAMVRAPGGAASAVQALLDAVRRHLWLRRFALAARAAAWATAGTVLLAALVHVAVQDMPVSLVLVAVGLVWSAQLAPAVWQRPADRACALWADQHLGGASAFTTLLEAGQGGAGPRQAQALRWVEHWAIARVPDSLQQLAARRETAHLVRPLLVMAVCSALASVVLMLPGPSPDPQQAAAARAAPRPPGNAPETALRLADAAEPAALASEIAAALRAAPPREAESTGAGGRAPAAGPSRADDGKSPAEVRAGPAPAGALPTDRPAPGGTADAAGPVLAGGMAQAGGGGGREAGDSADTRADAGVSRALRGTMGVTGPALAAARPTGQRQIDGNQAAAYQVDDGGGPGRAAMAARSRAAAATPPAATGSARLTPTQTSYVQAWTKASPQRP